MNKRRIFGFGLIVLALIGLAFFPLLGVSSQSGLCYQSIIPTRQSVACAPSTSYLDSMTFGGYVIAPSSNVVFVTGTSGVVTGYGFLASGATVPSSSVKYCLGSGCSPNIVLPTVSSGVNSQGLWSISANSPAMTLGTQYTYAVYMTDSAGTSSSVTGSVIPTVSSVSYVATLQTLNFTKFIGTTGTQAIIAAANVWNTESPTFTLTIQTNLNQVNSITLTVLPSSTTSAATGLPTSYTMNGLGGGVYQSILGFPLGGYTVTGTINLLAGTQTAFSVLITSIPQPQPTISYSTSSFTSLTISQSGTTCNPVNGVSVCSTTTTIAVCGTSACTGTSIVSGSTTITTSTQQTTSVQGYILPNPGPIFGYLLWGSIGIFGAILAIKKGKK